MSDRSAMGRLFMAALMAVFGLAARASADPISISTGDLNYHRSDRTAFVLWLPDGSLSGSFGNIFEGAPWPSYACVDCAPGATVNPSVTESWKVAASQEELDNSNTLSFGTTLTLNGATYAVKSFDFNINAAPLTVPDVNASTDWSKAFSTSPFTMTGAVMAMAPGGSLVRYTLFGSGTASVSFNFDGPSRIAWLGTNYHFGSPTSSPTPEPGTMLLLGGGIAAVLARRRNARQQLRLNNP